MGSPSFQSDLRTLTAAKNLLGDTVKDTISDAQWQTYQEQGYVRLGRVVSDHELEGLQRRIDEVMLGEATVPYDSMMMQLDTKTGRYEDMDPQSFGHKGPTLAYRKILGLEFDPLYLAYLQKPLFQDICQRAYGDIPISIYWAMFMNKPARKGTVLPWHWDYFYLVDRPPDVTVWMTMDATTKENGCLKILPGTHHLFPEDDLLDQKKVAEVVADRTPESLECPAGHAILMHNSVLHTSGVNQTDKPRRAFSVSYMDSRSRDSEGTAYSLVFGEGALKPESVGVKT